MPELQRRRGERLDQLGIVEAPGSRRAVGAAGGIDDAGPGLRRRPRAVVDLRLDALGAGDLRVALDAREPEKQRCAQQIPPVHLEAGPLLGRQRRRHRAEPGTGGLEAAVAGRLRQRLELEALNGAARPFGVRGRFEPLPCGDDLGMAIEPAELDQHVRPATEVIHDGRDGRVPQAV